MYGMSGWQSNLKTLSFSGNCSNSRFQKLTILYFGIFSAASSSFSTFFIRSNSNFLNIFGILQTSVAICSKFSKSISPLSTNAFYIAISVSSFCFLLMGFPLGKQNYLIGSLYVIVGSFLGIGFAAALSGAPLLTGPGGDFGLGCLACSFGLLSVLPTGDRGDVQRCLSLVTAGDPYPWLPPLFRSPKSSDPLLIMLLIADASVFEKPSLQGSPFVNSFVKLFYAGPTLNASSKLDDCFGLIVRPKLPYFSPDGDRGGVSPFCEGELGCF